MEVRQQNTSVLKTEIINNLRYFSGSDIYYTHRTFGYGFVAITEGANYIRSLGCYWLFDLILSHQYKLREEQFVKQKVVRGLLLAQMVTTIH